MSPKKGPHRKKNPSPVFCICIFVFVYSKPSPHPPGILFNFFKILLLFRQIVVIGSIDRRKATPRLQKKKKKKIYKMCDRKGGYLCRNPSPPSPPHTNTSEHPLSFFLFFSFFSNLSPFYFFSISSLLESRNLSANELKLGRAGERKGGKKVGKLFFLE